MIDNYVAWILLWFQYFACSVVTIPVRVWISKMPMMGGVRMTGADNLKVAAVENINFKVKQTAKWSISGFSADVIAFG